MSTSSLKRCLQEGLCKRTVFQAFLGTLAGAVIAASAMAAPIPGVDVVTADRQEAARLNNLGTALMTQQVLESAVEKFHAAATADPKLPQAALNEGIALLYLQKIPEARRSLLRATEMNAADPRAWYSLGILDRNTGNATGAIESFRHVLSIDPGDPDTHYILASIYLDQNERDKALTEYQTTLRLKPLHASATFGMAKVLQAQGKTEEARANLRRFEKMVREKISWPMTHAYGEEGRYAIVEDAPMDRMSVEKMIPIYFDIERSSDRGGEAASGAACVIDRLNNGSLELIGVNKGEHAVRFYRLEKGMVLVPEQETGISAAGAGVACAVGDFDNDGLSDVAIAFEDRIALYRNGGNGRFEDVTLRSGLRSMNRPAGLTFADYDHDGDLDLFVTGSPRDVDGSPAKLDPNVLWRNNGDGSFTEWTVQSGLGGSGETTAGTFSDVNNDRAVDLLVTGNGPSPMLYLNPREGQFGVRPLFQNQGLPPTVGVYVLDFDKDGWMDVALTHAGSPAVSLWRNLEGKRFERVALPLEDALRGWGITSIDVDNDGWLDLAAIVDTSQGTEVRVLRNRGQEGFEDVTEQLHLKSEALRGARSLVAADVDADGDADLIASTVSGAPLLLRNQGGNGNHAVRIALKGMADNKSALGTKVEVFADGLWQKWEITGGAGYLGQGQPQVLAGMGKATHVDIVRLLWPTGVPQDEIGFESKANLSITELDRRGSSCPTLFAWSGSKYEFISDVIGAGVIGHWVSATAKNIPDPDEWVKVPGSKLKERGGMVSLRFGEPMEEVNYLDKVRLVAVDHPAGTEVYPNERFLNQPPFVAEKTIVSAAAHPLAGAWDDRGQDVLDLLRDRDHRYVRDFRNLPYAGFANRHALTLDIGEWKADAPLRLLLHGFIEYFSASSMYAASQAGLTPLSPYVEAQRTDGSWIRVMDEMGFPAGLPRTIVVDLTGKLPERTRRIRLVTNLQIYWDQISVDNGSPANEKMKQTELQLAEADLEFRGYPRQMEGATPGDLTYDYNSISQTGPFQRSRGNYTRYGEVGDLLRAVDDRFVVFGTGEDIDLEFTTSGLPQLPPGWERDYFFYANGFVKDMDFYEASPFTVADMPFHGMSTYPYSKKEHYPADGARQDYLLKWNDRFESGANAGTYRFQYRPEAMRPPDRENGTVASHGHE